MNVDIYVDAILLYIIFKSLEKIILVFILFFPGLIFIRLGEWSNDANDFILYFRILNIL